MKVYQLFASGPYLFFNSTGKISSSSVFTSVPLAEKYKDKFIQMVTDESNMWSLDGKSDQFKVQILELEVIE